MLIYSNYCYNI